MPNKQAREVRLSVDSTVGTNTYAVCINSMGTCFAVRLLDSLRGRTEILKQITCLNGNGEYYSTWVDTNSSGLYTYTVMNTHFSHFINGDEIV